MSKLYLLATMGLFIIINIDITSAKLKRIEKQYTADSLSNPLECARDCRNKNSPKVCYYQFTLELYTTRGKACDLCTPNTTNTFTGHCQCILADGVEKGVLTANRMIPGPSIEVCEGDKVIVDVHNRMPGMETSIHWHGILQKDTQYYDGVPHVTQCPISEGNTFRYQWIAAKSGTFFWHSHSGFQKLNGLFGSIIVRKPKDPHSLLYDHDLYDHTITINDWMHHYAEEYFPGRVHHRIGQLPDAILINGKGQSIDPYTNGTTDTPLERFLVSPGKRYRFRLINSFAGFCPAQFSIQGHTLTVIATDGEPIEPVKVNSIVSFSGERYDFIVNADQTPAAYWVVVKGIQECGNIKIQQLAVLAYSEETQAPKSSPPTYDSVTKGEVLNPVDSDCDGSNANDICVSQLVGMDKNSSRICDAQPAVTLDGSFQPKTFSPKEFFQNEEYRTFFVGENTGIFTGVMNNMTFQMPSSPLLTQTSNLDEYQLCNQTSKPEKCNGNPYCPCTQIAEVPFGSLVEILLVDESPDHQFTHPFHLHGYVFQVVAMGRLPSDQQITMELFHDLDDQGLIRRCPSRVPPGKDSVMVPANGYAIVRFVADNPGYWLLHCHIVFHNAAGMKMVVHVHGDLPPVPLRFPKCGNFL